MPKTYTSVPSVSTGDVYQASTYNTYTATNINNLIVPPMCKAIRSGDLSYTSATAIAWNGTDEWDTDAMHDPATNNQFVYARTSGIYLVTASIHMTYTGTLTAIDATLYKNGLASNSVYQAGSYVNGVVVFQLSTYANAATDEYFEVRATVTGATSPVIKAGPYSFLSATWIGRTS